MSRSLHAPVVLAPAATSARSAETHGRHGVDDADAVAAEHEENAGRARERALVGRAQAGDMSAMREIYEAHAGTVFRCAILPLARDRALAEDLLADTFVRAMERLPQFRWQSRGVLPWLVRIGKNLTLDHLRRAGRQAAWPEGLEQRLPEASALLDAERSLGQAEVAEELGRRTAGCLEQLNPRYRRVIELRLVECRSRAEAAELLEVTVGTLDVLLFRACKAFRRIYVERHGADVDDPALFAP